MNSNTKQFVNDLVEYFKINTDKIDDFINSKINKTNTTDMYVTAVVKDRVKEVIKDMHKYECSKCKKIWYTSDPYANAQKCPVCGGKIKNKGVAK